MKNTAKMALFLFKKNNKLSPAILKKNGPDSQGKCTEWPF